jgi:hypothetical protein
LVIAGDLKSPLVRPRGYNVKEVQVLFRPNAIQACN